MVKFWYTANVSPHYADVHILQIINFRWVELMLYRTDRNSSVNFGMLKIKVL